MAKLSPEERAKDIVSYRIILFFVVAVASVLVLIPLRAYVDSPNANFAGYPLIKILIAVSAAVLIGGILLAVAQKKKGVDVGQHLFAGVDIATVGLALVLSFLYLLKGLSTAANVLFFAFPVMTFLAILFYIYQREFVLTSFYTAICTLMLYYIRYAVRMQLTGLLIGLVAATLVLGALLLAILGAAKKHRGYLFGLRFCEERKPWLLCAAVLVPAALVCAVLAAVITKIWIPIVVLAAVYAVLLVAYTTKLS